VEKAGTKGETGKIHIKEKGKKREAINQIIAGKGGVRAVNVVPKN